jgi:hypothetical protein
VDGMKTSSYDIVISLMILACVATIILVGVGG